MNIGDMNFHVNTAGTLLSGGDFSAPVLNQASDNPQSLSANRTILSVLEGQVFVGQIINVTGSDVEIMLEGNKILFAHMEDSMNLNIGDSFTFVVKENKQSNVVIRPFLSEASSASNQTVQKALEMNHFSPSPKNFQIAESLMKHNMPLDKSTMQQIMQQSIQYPDTPIDTIVHLNKLQIKVNPAAIHQYHSYVDGTHSLTNATEKLQQSIFDFFDYETNKMVSDGRTVEEIMQFQDKIISIFDSDTVNGEENLTKSELIKNLQSAKVGEIAETMIQAMEDMITHDASMPSKTPNSVDLLRQIHGLINDNTVTLPREELSKILQSDAYVSLFHEAVKQKLSMDKDTLQDASEIDKFYNKLYEKSNKLMDLFSEMGGKAGEQLREQAGNMKEHLEFIQNLNEMYAYAQMPMRLREDAFNSELFVYMNKKHVNEKKEAVSALLHLDMEHLGPTDVHVSLHGDIVHTKFYVEDETSAKLLDEHMNQLETAIKQVGFSLQNEVVVRMLSDTKTMNPVVNEMLGQDLEKSIKRYSFDVRM
ncbi:MAG: flagellar hook-length control protein FliK [Lachnospiraceae bacterium]|nr:flagellar hook-length control protein FliK [Lachnospiraceae bacterium]